MTNDLTIPEVKDITVFDNDLFERLQDAKMMEVLPVKSVSDYEATAKTRQAIKKLQKDLTDRRLELTRPLDQRKKELMSYVDKFIAEIGAIETKAAQELRKWDDARRAEQLEAERKANEAMRLQAEAEKKALADAALAAVKVGKDESALALLQKAEEVKPVVVVLAPVKPVAKGVSYTTYWHFEVTDASLIPREYLKVDEVKIGQVVRGLKETCSIPGVKTWSTKELSQR